MKLSAIQGRCSHFRAFEKNLKHIVLNKSSKSSDITMCCTIFPFLAQHYELEPPTYLIKYQSTPIQKLSEQHTTSSITCSKPPAYNMGNDYSINAMGFPLISIVSRPKNVKKNCPVFLRSVQYTDVD